MGNMHGTQEDNIMVTNEQYVAIMERLANLEKQLKEIEKTKENKKKVRGPSPYDAGFRRKVSKL